MSGKSIKKIVKESYGKIAEKHGCCFSCGNAEPKLIAKSIGYSDDEINVAPEANMGLGCGNPAALAEIRSGMTVLDLGSGAGFDCFLVARKVGSGR